MHMYIGIRMHGRTSRNEGIKPSEVEDPWSWKGQQRPSASSISIRPQIVEVCVSKVEILGMCRVVKGRCRCQSRVPVTRQLRSIFTWLQLDKCCNLQMSCILKRFEVCSFLDVLHYGALLELMQQIKDDPLSLKFARDETLKPRSQKVCMSPRSTYPVQPKAEVGASSLKQTGQRG